MNDFFSFSQIYWKMTNLGDLWRRGYQAERKNTVKRPGSIGWCFLPSGRSVSVYNSGRGFNIKIHDNMTYRSRHTSPISLGTVKKDTLCLDATEEQIAIGGLLSQKVWVFNVKEGPNLTRGAIGNFIDACKRRISPRLVSVVDEVSRRRPGEDSTRVSTEIYRFINAGAGVSNVKLHPDGKRIAVLLPSNQTVEVWDLSRVSRLQSHSAQHDSCYLLWKEDTLLTASLYSGVIQTVNTEKDRSVCTITGGLRRIDAVALAGSLCATGEGRSINLYTLTDND